MSAATAPAIGEFFDDGITLFRIMRGAYQGSVLVCCYPDRTVRRIDLPLSATLVPPEEVDERISLSWLRSLASDLELQPKELAHLVADSDAHYRSFQMPKRRGGFREIAAPDEALKLAQRQVLSRVLFRAAAHPAASGFIPGKSIAHNASQHASKQVVVRVDITDFFGSIRFPLVVSLFRSLRYSDPHALALARLCTIGHSSVNSSVGEDGEVATTADGSRRLPQGAPTSPAISNLVCRPLDEELEQLGRASGFAYSRYADDLVFSRSDKATGAGPLIHEIRKRLRDHGFAMNEEKTRIMYQHQRQVVTGLVVNTRPRVSRTDLRRFRALLHRCSIRGLDAVSAELGRSAYSYISGYLAFVHMVDPQRVRAILKSHRWLSHLATEESARVALEKEASQRPDAARKRRGIRRRRARRLSPLDDGPF